MPEDENTAVKKEKGFFESLSVIQKAILFLLVLTLLFVAWVFLFGGVNSVWELAFVIILTGVVFFIGYLLIFASKLIFKQAYYSPKEDWFTRLVNTAMDFCPNNLNDLYFMGNDWKKTVRGGKIIGCLGIPYLIGKPKLKDGKMQWYKSKLLNKKIPVFESIEYGMEGDTLIIYEKGWFIWAKKHYLRCHRSLHSDLNGDVVIKDINPVPYGKFFEYPFKQIQAQAPRIMLQSQLEVIIATHEHQGDLISQAADSGTYYNPFFRMVEKGKAEIARES